MIRLVFTKHIKCALLYYTVLYCIFVTRKVLSKTPHQHPLLYLKGVSSKDMMALLDFMYNVSKATIIKYNDI